MRLRKKMNELLKRLLSGLIFLVVFWGTFYFNTLSFNILILIVALVGVYELRQLLPWAGYKFYLASLIYPTMPFFFIYLLNTEQYRSLLMIYFVTVFAFDSGSYVFGKSFGKLKICPVSPNKTWEGFFGGVVAVIICLELYFWFIPSFGLLALSTIFGFLALTGDLFESWLKRRACVKDSSCLIPGHGGILDRFDTITFTIPLIYIFRDAILSKMFI